MKIIDSILGWWRRESGKLPSLWNDCILVRVRKYWINGLEKVELWRSSKVVRVGFLLVCVPCLLLILLQVGVVRASVGSYYHGGVSQIDKGVRNLIGVGEVNNRLSDLEMRSGSEQGLNSQLQERVNSISAELESLSLQSQVIYNQFLASTSGVEKLAGAMDEQLKEMVSLADQVKAASSNVTSSVGSSTAGKTSGVTASGTSGSISGSSTGGNVNQVTGKVNINTADKATLMTLSGVGEAKAQAILDYRNTNGPFKTAEDLDNVKGIGPSMIAELKDKITL